MSNEPYRLQQEALLGLSSGTVWYFPVGTVEDYEGKKGKMQPYTGTKALYRPYGPKGE